MHFALKSNVAHDREYSSLVSSCNTIHPLTGVTMHLLISVWANACCLVVLCAINIRTVVKSPISSAYWSSTPLVQKMPMETGEWSMLRALVLQK